MTYDLPLFPLNSVLFPGMPITLHVFEERYIQMIRLCLMKQLPFGVVLIREGQEALGPVAMPHEFGCTAEIAHRHKLPGGRMNILALGKERFRIRTTTRERPYLLGEVEDYPLSGQDEEAVAVAGRQLRQLIERYLALLNQADVDEFDVSQLPGDPVNLGYIGAGLLQTPAAQKQELLACAEATDFLQAMCRIYRKEIPLLRFILQQGPAQLGGSEVFSLN